MVTYTELRARFLADTGLGGSGAAPVLERALERIGWRSVQEPTTEELASHLVMFLDACVHEHRDAHALAYAIASVMRDTGPSLDGGLPPTEAYLPAAEELLRLYVKNAFASTQDPFF